MDGDPYFNNVALLLHMDGSNGSTTFTDSSINGFTATPYGNAQVSTSQSKFGGASGVFDGSGDYLLAASNAAFNFGTNDFTVEMWARPTQNTATAIMVGLKAATWNMTMYARFTAKFALYHSAFGSGPFIEGGTVSTNTWHHVAFVRKDGVFRIYVNGVSVGSSSQSLTLDNADVYIGQSGTSSQYWVGHLDDIRITNGVARYTANFTPPSGAFPDFAGYDPITSILHPTLSNRAAFSNNRIHYQGL